MGDATERSMGPLGVVLVDPDWQALEVFSVRAIAPADPHSWSRVLMYRSVCRWSAAGVAESACDGRRSPQRSRDRSPWWRPRVVRQDPLDPDAVAGEPDRRIEEGLAGAPRTVVGHVRDVRQTCRA